MLLRKGMWVLYSGKVGILVGFRGSQGEVDFVDKEGVTVAQGVVPLAGCAQASLADIPAKRRPNLALARALGYLRS